MYLVYLLFWSYYLLAQIVPILASESFLVWPLRSFGIVLVNSDSFITIWFDTMF